MLKPGGYLLCFRRHAHPSPHGERREDAGFRSTRSAGPSVSGFPKSHNGEWGGTALPAWEPIVLAQAADRHGRGELGE